LLGVARRWVGCGAAWRVQGLCDLCVCTCGPRPLRREELEEALEEAECAADHEHCR
jgi:hypothetical protein